jgi:cbb3-type cytochrome oxidase subunit 3
MCVTSFFFLFFFYFVVVVVFILRRRQRIRFVQQGSMAHIPLLSAAASGIP